MYTILSYLKDLTCNAQFNFCFSSYYSFKPFLFFEARLCSSPQIKAVAGFFNQRTRIQDPLTHPAHPKESSAFKRTRRTFVPPASLKAPAPSSEEERRRT